MVNQVLRGVIFLWAALFLVIGLQGLLASAPYLDLLGPLSSATGINTARADLSAFFLVSATFALIGVLRPGHERALVVPAALFGAAFAGRAFGLAFGDEPTAQVTQAMGIEAVSLVLLLVALRQLKAGASV